ncbi:MAG TPA: thioesterase family protein [Polyangia bacterium]|nr:thioesterase family protein [Polyangia bacterium]
MPAEPVIASAAPAPLREVALVRVIYGDTDQMGMVYYANYLRYFEIARNEYLRLAGSTYRAFEETHGLMLPVVEAQISYHRPARYDDELVIAAAVHARGAASVRFEYEIRRAPDGEKLVSGRTVHACITREGRVVRLPAALRAAVGLGPSPEAAAG